MVAGIGCRAGVSREQVEAAIAAALAALGAPVAPRTAVSHPGEQPVASRSGLTAIATPAAKATEPGIRAAAATRGIPLLAISQLDLEASDAATVTRSAQSMAAMNVHSVAEAAALAGARKAECARTAASAIDTGLDNPTPRLLQPRVAVGPVTCALADTTTP